MTNGQRLLRVIEWTFLIAVFVSVFLTVVELGSPSVGARRPSDYARSWWGALHR